MKLYKCNKCGRVFGEPISHKCGNVFRKHKLSWTEIDDSTNEYELKNKPNKDDILKKELCDVITKWGIKVTEVEQMDIERIYPFDIFLSRTILTVTFKEV